MTRLTDPARVLLEWVDNNEGLLAQALGMAADANERDALHFESTQPAAARALHQSARRWRKLQEELEKLYEGLTDVDLGRES